MSRGTVLALALATVGLAAAAWWLTEVDPSAAPASRADALPAAVEGPPAVGPTGVAAPAPVDVPPGVDGPPEDAGAAPRAWLVGRVTRRADGRPLPGLEITASFTSDALDEDRTRGTTDDDGRYVFALVENAEVRWIEVPPTPTTTRWRAGRGLSVRLGEETVLDVEVPGGATLSGRVVDLDGRPAGDARVDGWTGTRYAIERRLDRPDRTVTTDAAGHFTIDGLGPSFLLAAAARDRVTHTRLHGTAALGARLVDLVLVVSPPWTLRGRVEGPGGRPVTDARLTFVDRRRGAEETVTSHEDVYRMGTPDRVATSGSDGAFVLDGLPALVHSVTVEHDRHQPWRGEHGPGDGELVVRLASGSVLTGTVTDLAGRPVGAAEVVFDTAGFGESRRRRTTTDAAGAPFAGARVTIAGDRLVDYGGATLAPEPRWESHVFPLDAATTDADGAFAFPRLYDGLFRVRATAPDDDVTALLDARSGRDDLVLVLDPGAIVGVTLFGRVTDAVTGLPVPDFFVTPMIPSGEHGLTGTSHVFEDTDGDYRIPGLDPGEMQVNVSAGGYAPWWLPLRRFDAGAQAVDVALLPTRTVRLVTVDEEGERLPGVRLSFADGEGRPLMGESGPSSRSSNLETDDRGEAIAAGLPADRVTVEAKRGWFASGEEFAVDLRHEPRGPVELRLGGGDETAILVFVVTGTPERPLERDRGLQALLESLEREVAAGRLRPLAGTSHVVATRDDGRVVAESAIDPDAPAELRLPGIDRPITTRLSVPVDELDVEVRAEGFEVQTQTWRPESGRDEPVMLFVMTPS